VHVMGGVGVWGGKGERVGVGMGVMLDPALPGETDIHILLH